MKRFELEELFNTYLGRYPNDYEVKAHGNKNYEHFKKELVNCDEYKRLSRGMERSEMKELFNTYLNRNPTDKEYRIHGKKKYNDFKIELLNCDEYRRSSGSTNSSIKVAFLLSGHIRNNTIANSLNNLMGDYNCDVFIHTWDTVGKKGKETDLNDSVLKNKVVENINRIKNVRNYMIENNHEYIQSIKSDTEDNIYFNYSSPEIFIKSQLYSINKSYKLMEEYSKANKIKYSAVFRLRFDCEFTSFNLTNKILQDINNHNIIFVSNSDAGHSHADSNGTSCMACDRMYYSHDLKSVHIFEHTNVICDIFAYGSQKSMKDYCSLYFDYDKLNKSFVKDNLKYLETKNIRHTKNKNVYKIQWNHRGHLESLYYLNCSYPERLLQKKLKNYMLIDSRTIKIKFKR